MIKIAIEIECDRDESYVFRGREARSLLLRIACAAVVDGMKSWNEIGSFGFGETVDNIADPGPIAADCILCEAEPEI